MENKTLCFLRADIYLIVWWILLNICVRIIDNVINTVNPVVSEPGIHILTVLKFSRPLWSCAEWGNSTIRWRRGKKSQGEPVNIQPNLSMDQINKNILLPQIWSNAFECSIFLKFIFGDTSLLCVPAIHRRLVRNSHWGWGGAGRDFPSLEVIWRADVFFLITFSVHQTKPS